MKKKYELVYLPDLANHRTKFGIQIKTDHNNEGPVVKVIAIGPSYEEGALRELVIDANNGLLKMDK